MSMKIEDVLSTELGRTGATTETSRLDKDKLYWNRHTVKFNLFAVS